MATGPVQIANLALSWLGQNQINSLTDEQNEARVMNANYALSRDKVMGGYAWTFAIRREVLSPTATAPAFGYSNSFLIPSDVLTVHRVLRPESQGTIFTSTRSRDLPMARWEKEGQFILSNDDVVHCIFIFRNTNTDQYHPAFNHALAAMLAADTALTFTEDKKLEQRMVERYDTKVAEASFADGRQGRTERAASKLLTGTRRR